MGVAAVDVNGNDGQEKSFSQIAKYPYEQLIKPADELPEGVDPTQREVCDRRCVGNTSVVSLLTVCSTQ